MTIDQCINKEIAERQRKNELQKGLGLDGTEGYKIAGCYDCDGYKKECEKYLVYKIK